MSAPYLLALDLGTSSIGFVVFELDGNDQPVSILDLGVRIFPDGRDPKTREPLAVERRLARGLRRNRDRGQNRVRRLVDELISFNLLPKEEGARSDILQRTCPYRARHLAATETVEAYTLGRALFHLGRRRGFKSNRLAGESEESEYKEKITALGNLLKEQTLGSYLYAIQQSNLQLSQQGRPDEQQVVRFRNGETNFYADRQMYYDEFEQIKAVQGTQLLSNAGWAALQETIFWQYPLKPVAKGKCRFFPEEERAHIDLPISHQYRIYQEVNQLRYVSEGVEHELDERQKKSLYDKLHKQLTLSFKAIVKLKDSSRAPYFPSDAVFNLDVGNRSGKLAGNKTYIQLGKPEYLGALVEELDSGKLNDVVQYLIEPIIERNGRKALMDVDELKDWLRRELPPLTDEQIQNLCGYRFKRDTAAVSRKFMDKIVPIMRNQGLMYSDAVRQVENDQGMPFHHSDFETGEVYERLPYYGKLMPESVWGAQPEADKDKPPHERDNDAYEYGKIANPTVHVALNQLRVVVNRVIDKQGSPPAKIHVELTRDLKNSKDARERIVKQNTQNKKDNDRIRQFLEEELDFERVGRTELQKVKLWEELETQGVRSCVFTGRPISARNLFNGEVEIEHIVPFSRCYDDGMQNKTLAFKQANLVKGNRTPHEAFANDSENYQAILRRALTAFGPGNKYDRFKEDAFERFYGADRGGDMIARQLNDTRYLSRKAKQYLSCLCTSHNVVSVNGMMTAVLRDVWQLNNYKNRAEGNYREDHRHHIVDAFVVGLTSRSLIQQLSTVRSGRHQDKDDLYHFLKARVQDIPDLKAQLRQLLDEVVASYKPDHATTGSLFNDTAYGLAEDEKGNTFGITRRAPVDLSFDEVFRINDTHRRRELLTFLAGQPDIADKKTLKEILKTDKALSQRAAEWSAATGIKKLRITLPNNSIQAIGSAPYKGYAKNSYAYCDVWRIPAKKDKTTGQWRYEYRGDFAAYSELRERKERPEFGKPHPAAKKLMRLYKQDILKMTDKETSEIKYMRVAGYSTGQNKLDLRPNLQATNTGQKFESINVIFDKYVVHKLRG